MNKLYRRCEELSTEENIQKAMGTWVWSLAPWQVFSTMTFKWEASQDSVRRCYEKFMRAELPWVSYFYAIEQNPSRDGHHVHAIWCDCEHSKRRDIWRDWFAQYGRARIEPVRGQDDVALYVAKYVTKGNAWWDLRLMGTRHPAQRELDLVAG